MKLLHSIFLCFIVLGLSFILPYSNAQSSNIKILGHSCYKADIVNNYNDGRIIEADDGHIYQVNSYDTFDTQLWLPTDTLLICYTTASVNGTIMKVYTLRNLDENDDDSDGVDAIRLK
jgi:hypothetical protein